MLSERHTHAPPCPPRRSCPPGTQAPQREDGAAGRTQAVWRPGERLHLPSDVAPRQVRTEPPSSKKLAARGCHTCPQGLNSRPSPSLDPADDNAHLPDSPVASIPTEDTAQQAGRPASGVPEGGPGAAGLTAAPPASPQLPLGFPSSRSCAPGPGPRPRWEALSGAAGRPHALQSQGPSEPRYSAAAVTDFTPLVHSASQSRPSAPLAPAAGPTLSPGHGAVGGPDDGRWLRLGARPRSHGSLEPGFCAADKSLCPSPPTGRGPRVPGGKSAGQGRTGFGAGAKGAAPPPSPCRMTDRGGACGVDRSGSFRRLSPCSPPATQHQQCEVTRGAECKAQPRGALTAPDAARTPALSRLHPARRRQTKLRGAQVRWSFRETTNEVLGYIQRLKYLGRPYTVLQNSSLFI